jgi:hypothetical protein
MRMGEKERLVSIPQATVSVADQREGKQAEGK